MNVASHPLQGPPAAPVGLRPAHLSLALPGRSWNPMPTNDELNEWMTAVATREDRQSFAALFRHFAPRVKGYLMRCGCAHELADELTQETMVLLWRRASTFDPRRASLATWLFTIVRNVRIDQHRRRSTSADGAAETVDVWEIDQPPADPALDPQEMTLALQRERGIQRALAELPQEQARLVKLSFFEEQPHARIAQELGIPLGTVKSRIRRAMLQLREKLEGWQP